MMGRGLTLNFLAYLMESYSSKIFNLKQICKFPNVVLKPNNISWHFRGTVAPVWVWL